MNQLHSDLRFGTSVAAVLLEIVLVCCALGSAVGTPLSADSLVKEVELYPYEGILPSPDGKWVAYEASNPQRVIRFEYEGQRFAKSGYPMLAGASAISVWVTELSTGKSFQLTSSEASSWSPSWSPDGMRLAFYSDRSGQAALWVWDLQSKASKQISPVEIFFSWWRERPLWSADGKTILTKVLPEGMGLEDVLKLSPFYADALNKGKIKEADPKTSTVHVYSYHPSKNSATTETSENSASGDFSAFFDALYLSDLVRIDLASGKVTRIAKRIRPMWYGYCPDQTRIAYASIDGVVPRTQQNIFNVRVYSVANGATANVAEGFMDPNDLTTEVSWSPDGKRIAYHNTGKTAERAAYVVDVQSGTKVKVSDGIPESARTFSWGPPLWDKTGTKLYLLDSEAGRLWEVAVDGTKAREIAILPGLAIKDIATDEAASTYWSPGDGNTLYVRTHDGESKKDAIYGVRVDGGETKKVYEGDESISLREMGALTGTPHDNLLVFCSESATRPLDLWTLDVGTGHTHQISRLNPQYDENSMGKARIIDWLSLQGEHLRGALLLPGDYEQGKRYPMVVWIYGGDMGSDKVNRFAFGWGTTFNPQMWASRGYAVLYPDIPLHPGTPVDDLVSAVIPGINKAVELGFADPARLAVMGQSFGGYNTIALLTRTSIFKAAVATSAASTDLFAAYTYFLNGTAPSEGYYEEGQGGMKGSPWDFKTRYYDNSPFFFLERVTTPLMIQRGTADLISIQSGNVYNALRRLGKDVELLEYDTEDHVVQQPVNVIDFWNRRIDWLGRYLNPRNETGSVGGSAEHDQ